jgi:leucyl-tRNA synthetase
MLAPLAPYAAEELWRVELGNEGSVHRSAWPAYDPALAVDDTVTLVVQVNGKVRDKLEVPADIEDDAALAAARESAGAQRSLQGREIVREIVRAPRLVNFVVKG